MFWSNSFDLTDKFFRVTSEIHSPRKHIEFIGTQEVRSYIAKLNLFLVRSINSEFDMLN